MKDVIYLIVNRSGVQGMRKSLPQVHRGEIPVKINVTVPEGAFTTPVLEQHITVNDWEQGIDLKDVEFRHSIITADEAETIRQNRLAKMKAILEEQGYTVQKENENAE